MTATEGFARIACGAADTAFESLKASFSDIRSIRLHDIPMLRYDDVDFECYEVEWHVTWSSGMIESVSVKCMPDFVEAGADWLQERLAGAIIAQVAGLSTPSMLGLA